MVLARRVVAADDRYAFGEIERLDLLYREMELPAVDAGEPDDAGDLNLLFDTPQSRALVVLNLLLVAHADGALDAREAAAVRRVADGLGVGEDDLVRMEAWAERYAVLVREADEVWLREG